MAKCMQRGVKKNYSLDEAVEIAEMGLSVLLSNWRDIKYLSLMNLFDTLREEKYRPIFSRALQNIYLKTREKAESDPAKAEELEFLQSNMTRYGFEIPE